MANAERPRTTLDKSEVLEGLFASWDSIDALLSGLTDEQWQAPTSLPGWAVHNVVSHVAGTELMLAGEPNPDGDITARRKATLSAMSDDEWNIVTFTPAGPDSYGRSKRVRAFDCWIHDHDIRRRSASLGWWSWSSPWPVPMGMGVMLSIRSTRTLWRRV